MSACDACHSASPVEWELASLPWACSLCPSHPPDSASAKARRKHPRGWHSRRWEDPQALCNSRAQGCPTTCTPPTHLLPNTRTNCPPEASVLEGLLHLRRSPLAPREWWTPGDHRPRQQTQADTLANEPVPFPYSRRARDTLSREQACHWAPNSPKSQGFHQVAATSSHLFWLPGVESSISST